MRTDEDDGSEDPREWMAAVRRCLKLYIMMASTTADVARLEAVTGTAHCSTRPVMCKEAPTHTKVHRHTQRSTETHKGAPTTWLEAVTTG
eukprot:1161856-Pelagomonas_calceolata.AAC.3